MILSLLMQTHGKKCILHFSPSITPLVFFKWAKLVLQLNAWGLRGSNLRICTPTLKMLCADRDPTLSERSTTGKLGKITSKEDCYFLPDRRLPCMYTSYGVNVKAYPSTASRSCQRKHRFALELLEMQNSAYQQPQEGRPQRPQNRRQDHNSLLRRVQTRQLRWTPLPRFLHTKWMKRLRQKRCQLLPNPRLNYDFNVDAYICVCVFIGTCFCLSLPFRFHKLIHLWSCTLKSTACKNGGHKVEFDFSFDVHYEV